jgi:hypothetical protein
VEQENQKGNELIILIHFDLHLFNLSKLVLL